MRQKYTIMSKYRILIVDDEEDICMILSYSLQQAGYEPIVVHSAEEALQQYEYSIRNAEIDLILLDIMMDGMSGLEMAKVLHSQSDTIASKRIPPIIFLTALSDESTILKGFTLGADDYISKPFRLSEVLARVSAVLRRTTKKIDSEPNITISDAITYAGIVVNKSDMSLMVDGSRVKITRKEIELLCYLLTHQGQVLSRERLLSEVWDQNGYVLERTVDVHITHLRRKLGAYGKHIITKSGYGYLFES